jgi:HEAT repeat protein
MPDNARKREVLRLAQRLLSDDLSFKGVETLPNSCWIQGPPEVVARGETARALGEFGPEAIPAVPALVRVLSDRNVRSGERDCHRPWEQTVADLAAEALVKIGRPAVPALIEALASPDEPVRFMAATVLGKIGAPAASAAPALAACVRAEQNEVGRKHLAWALRRVGAKAARRHTVSGRTRSRGRGK